MFNKKDSCLFLTKKSDTKKIKEMENTMEYILEEARYLISQEIDVTNTPLNLITGVNKKRKEAIRKLNVKLSDLGGAKREVLQREHLLQTDSRNASLELRKIQKKEEELEKRIVKLLQIVPKPTKKKKTKKR